MFPSAGLLETGRHIPDLERFTARTSADRISPASSRQQMEYSPVTLRRSSTRWLIFIRNYICAACFADCATAASANLHVLFQAGNPLKTHKKQTLTVLNLVKSVNNRRHMPRESRAWLALAGSDHQHRRVQFVPHGVDRSAENQVFKAAVSVGAHNYQVRLDLACVADNFLAGGRGMRDGGFHRNALFTNGAGNPIEVLFAGFDFRSRRIPSVHLACDAFLNVEQVHLRPVELWAVAAAWLTARRSRSEWSSGTRMRR